jgi:hypothetical protein
VNRHKGNPASLDHHAGFNAGRLGATKEPGDITLRPSAMAAPRRRLHVLEQAGKVHPGERVEQRRTCGFYEGVNVEVARQKRVKVEVAQRKFLAGNQGKRYVVAAAPEERNMVKKTEPLAQLNIKIAPALRRAIEKAALAEERSISNFAQKVLGA